MNHLNVLILRVCRGQWERCEVGTWLVDSFCQAGTLQVKMGQLLHGVIDGEPTSAARNAAVLAARQAGAGALIMVDADMAPAPGFFAHAVKFLTRHTGAVVIGSPYCGAPPGRLVQVTGREDFERVPRSEAARKAGDELVGCIGTGLLACRLEAFEAVEAPWFDYGYEDEYHAKVDRTEDFFFTRRLTEAGGRVYAAFDHWSGHAKESVIGKPDEE